MLHGSASRRSVTSGVAQGLGLGLVPFNTVVGRTGSRTERARRRFADDTELCAAVGTAEGREGIQRDLDGPARWPCANLMMSNKAKHKVLQLGQGKPHHQIRPAEPHLIHIPLTASRHRDSTASLGNSFQCLAPLSIINSS